MKITHALLGEHGAIYPLLDLIGQAAPTAGLEEIRSHARALQAALVSHADIEDAVLRPAIQRYLPQPAPGADGCCPPSDHQVIGIGLRRVIEASGAEQARRLLVETVDAARRHFTKEETVIFGIAERELSEELQQKLGARWAAMRKIAAR
jgi:hypothetical protein